jgi:hypothetical protein
MSPSGRAAIAAAVLAACPTCAFSQTEGGTVTALDNAVVSVVLRDLLTYNGKDSPVQPPFGPSRPFPVARKPLRGQMPLADAAHSCGLTQARWRQLTPAQRRATEEANRQLAQRAPLAVGSFEVAVPDIELREENQRPRRDDVLFNIGVTLPGYSGSGRIATVQLSIPWSIHSASGVYVLRLVDSKWQVLAREFAIYP